MTLTISWGTGSPTRTWNLSPVPAGVSLPTPAAVKWALHMAEPVLMIAAEAAGAGVPELLLVVAAVQLAKHMLSQTRPAGPEPSPTLYRGDPTRGVTMSTTTGHPHHFCGRSRPPVRG